MKKSNNNSKLFIGLGVGLLVGAALGVYFGSSDEQKEAWMDDINATVDRAKRKIGKAIDEGMDELEEAKDKVAHAAERAVSKARRHV